MANNHQEKAVALFKEGYNCAQAVFAAYSEELGMDTETALKLSSSFGGGMGRMREVCGAVSGMFMAAGMKYGYSDPKDTRAKAEHYKLIQDLAQKFKAQNGSIICKDLLGLSRPEGTPIPQERTADYYKKRPCVEMVRCAAEILDEYLNENESKQHASQTTLERQV
jgi:C_GCAxxG_C_C family probable redox protein